MKYNQIENYGIIGDQNTVALISNDGSIDFMCYPDFDSPTVFARLLDNKKGGHFDISPRLKQDKKVQMYLPDTNVLLSRFLSDEGVSEITDFMTPAEANSENVIVRKITCIRGEIDYRVECCPRFNYARSEHRVETDLNAVCFVSEGKNPLVLKLMSTVELSIVGQDVKSSFRLKAGESAEFILFSPNNLRNEILNIEDFVNKSLYSTINFWKMWCSHSSYRERWVEITNRSLLTLKLLTYHKTGGLVASATFGLPEEIGGVKNWDYRYVWIRDASFFMYTIIKFGFMKEARNFLNWLENYCEGTWKPGQLGLMYTINGKSVPDEIYLSHLEGYKGSSPVRVGNNANSQIQLDIYGELIDSIYIFNQKVEPISYELWKSLQVHLDWLSKHWHEKDEGIWEVRGGKRHFLYSRFMCWVAFDRAIKLAISRSFPYKREWYDIRDQIFNSIYREFWNSKSKYFVQFKGAKTVDASILLMPIMHFISPKDPMWRSTMKVIEDRLITDALVYRYRENEEIVGLQGGEGTFAMCTFWYIECLTRAGELYKARLFFEKVLGYSSHLGLFSEQISKNGEMLGNFPQALTHLGLLDAVNDLDKILQNTHSRTGRRAH